MQALCQKNSLTGKRTNLDNRHRNTQMNMKKRSILDGNEAAANIAYQLSETIAIYPITPSSPMAESCDEWAAYGRPNLFGGVPSIAEMQSEAGAAGAIHGMLQSGALTTTFTASQGLLLMIPNMYKIAGELLPFCMHVTARSLATHALSIFGDHSDIMACRQTGFAMLCSNNVQECQDMAAIAHATSLKSRVPFMHFFDGFRTSHEINTFAPLATEDLLALIDMDAVRAFRSRALTPDKPSVRGTAQNPDVFFQAREAANPFYDILPEFIKETMAQFGRLTGRNYAPFEYVGDPNAEQIIVTMGSSCETVEETVRFLNKKGARTGVIKVRLYRPFLVEDFCAILPRSVRSIAVLDRTKEPGAVADPLYLDVVAALEEGRAIDVLPDAISPRIIGGRYGLGSKEFTPAMVKAVFDELLKSKPKRRFTVGIVDDVTGTSLPVDNSFSIEAEAVYGAVFYGLGSDGTVGANKNTIKIIGTETDMYAQGYFVYDSKKSGAMTVSHLRFGPDPIRAPYLVNNARFVGCHQFSFMERYDVLEFAAKGAVFLINSTFGADKVWDHLPLSAQRDIIEKQLKVYTIDAYRVAREAGMGARINTIMQTAFFAISGVLPRDEAIAKIKEAIEKTYSKKGQAIVDKNFEAVDTALAFLEEVVVPDAPTSTFDRHPAITGDAPDFIKKVTAVMLENKGDLLPVSAFPVDGVWPTGTTRYEKRNIAQEIPVWEPEICIQCNKCVFVCPHAAIRAKFYDESAVAGAPEAFKSIGFKSREIKDQLFTIQVAPEDCTGCNMCVEVCPAKARSGPERKAIMMQPNHPIKDQEKANFEFFLNLPEPDTATLGLTIKESQFRTPLFEFSGACAGCGETPYIKTLTQLLGDRLLIANATGCSSIFGGNLPTTPYTQNADGRGPAWANSLFEDNAEFGLGMRLAVKQKRAMAEKLLQQVLGSKTPELVHEILTANQSDDSGIRAQRDRVTVVRTQLSQIDTPEARDLDSLADYLVEKSVWILGGDGWAYDIGSGGLDHVLASGENVNILVLDTGTYSNTGGQQSKATPMGAVAKFAAAGKAMPKKDLALQAIMYGHVYVAQIAMGAKDSQTLQALAEAQSYDGPSLIIAYSHCVSHGFEMCSGLDHQKNAVAAGVWPLYRYDPRRAEAGEPGLKLDSKAPTLSLEEFMSQEARFQMLRRKDPERAKDLTQRSERHIRERFLQLQQMAGNS